MSTSNIGGSTGIGPKVLDDLGPECQLDHAGPFGSIGVARGQLIAKSRDGHMGQHYCKRYRDNVSIPLSRYCGWNPRASAGCSHLFFHENTLEHRLTD